jgi:hypothetical protein
MTNQAIKMTVDTDPTRNNNAHCDICFYITLYNYTLLIANCMSANKELRHKYTGTVGQTTCTWTQTKFNEKMAMINKYVQIL